MDTLSSISLHAERKKRVCKTHTSTPWQYTIYRILCWILCEVDCGAGLWSGEGGFDSWIDTLSLIGIFDFSVSSFGRIAYGYMQTLYMKERNTVFCILPWIDAFVIISTTGNTGRRSFQYSSMDDSPATRRTGWSHQHGHPVRLSSKAYCTWDNQLAIACPISSGESSWGVWCPRTVTSRSCGQVR